MSSGITRSVALWSGVGSVAALLGGMAVLAVWTGPEREAVRTYTRLLSAANRQDVEGAARLCTVRYRASHSLRPAEEGGIVGLPRNIHPNFKAWREGSNVWLCPSNRVGPIYQFVRESGSWRFDGPIGLLMSGGRVVKSDDAGIERSE
jgi:hypothetical protein